MAQVTITKLVEGPSVVIVKVDLLNNDNSGELTDYVFFSPTDASPPHANNQPLFRVMQMWYGAVWFDTTISTGGPIAPYKLWTIARDTNSHTDFRSFGGLTDPTTHSSPPADTLGVLKISTNGFATAGSQGTIILELRKLS